MALIEALDGVLGFRRALIVGLAISAATLVGVMPIALAKLRGAKVVGHDIHKPGRPAIPEMGGLAVFLSFHAGVFIVLAFSFLDPKDEGLILVTLIVGAGAAVTGILDDLLRLRQQFKAFIPIGFSIPLALYVEDTAINFPFVGLVEFGILYPLILVPLAVAAASNGLNMLEGFNGLGAGIATISIAAMATLAVISNQLLGLVILAPLGGAVASFLYYNFYPAKVFPGDSFTLFVGALLAAASILSQVEFWAALLFVPHVAEFFLKARNRFAIQSFAERVEGHRLVYEGPVSSLPHILMKTRRMSEPRLVITMLSLHLIWSSMVVGIFAFVGV